MCFTDWSTASDSIVDNFLRVSETSEGALAVHCLAGLGRTDTLIAMYMMKHLLFSADKAMAWLCMCAPAASLALINSSLQTSKRACGRSTPQYWVSEAFNG